MISAAEVAVVIPYYKNELTITERIALDRCRQILGKYPIHFVAPSFLEINKQILCSSDKITHVPNKWMSSLSAYNQMMLCQEFYCLFKNYKYMLLYQLDSYLFSDRLLEFCALEYDYIGAPWMEGKFDIEHEEYGLIYVGNGGFSLRNIMSCISVLRENNGKIINCNEDLFWGAQNSEYFKVAPVSIAVDFAFERPARKLFEKNGNKLPFGCHAWMKYDFDFFKPYIIKDGYYDIENFKPEYEYDKSTQYTEKLFFMASEAEIEEVIKDYAHFVPKRVYIHGCGKDGIDCGYLIKRLKHTMIQYVDRNEDKWGKEYYGILTTAPQEIDVDDKTLIIVTVKHYEEVLNDYKKRGWRIGKNIIVWATLVDLLNSRIKKIKIENRI